MSSSKTARRFAVIIAILIAVRSGTVFANELGKTLIDEIRVGFAGRDGVSYYKVGYWTPVEVTLSAGSQEVRGDLEVVVPDGDGVPTRVVEPDVSVAATAKKSVRVYVKFGRPHAPIGVILRGPADGVVLGERTFSGDEVPPALGAKSKSGATKLILELGSAVEFGSAIRFNDEGEPEETAVVNLDDVAQWPDRSYGYDGVDLVVVTTGDPKVFQQAPAGAFDALDRWLHLGGKLLVSVGKNGSELLAPGKPLQRFTPGTFDKTTNEGSQQFVAALENFAGTAEPLDVAESPGGGRASLTGTLLQRVRGRIEATTDPSHPENAPLVIRAPSGFGETIFFGADLDLPPISRWKARPELLATLVGRRSTAAASGGEPRGQGMQYGYDDLAGQLRASLDHFTGVELVPFWLVALLAAGYILLLFPLDYLLGARARAAERLEESRVAGIGGSAEGPAGAPRDRAGDSDRRSAGPGSALPWIRFAAIVAGLVLAAVYLGARMKGDQVKRTEATLLDYDLESGLARGTNWLGLYSPSSQSYSLELHPIWQQPHKETTETRLSWLGLPGSGIGGMNAPPAELAQFTTPYDVSAVSPSVGPVPLATWSSKSFTGRWSGKANPLIDADLRENSDRQLTGVIKTTKNAGHDFKLTHCTLFHDRWAYTIDAFSAAEPINIERLEATTSETLLTNRHNIGERDQVSPYDRGGLDTARILQLMMFYKLAGGRKYTSLLNRYEHELDLTDQLALGRAILVGYGPPAAEIEIDGRSTSDEAPDKSLTIYRFIIPVESTAGQGTSIKPK